MSPRAACRLETLGFSAVHDYAAGKADWLAAGLPTEGSGAATLRPGGIARTDVPTCRPEDRVQTARHRTATAGGHRCVVLSNARVVLGVLDDTALAGEERTLAGDVMRPRPVTVRAHEDLPNLVGRMRARDVTEILVTDPDGRLLGVLHRTDAEAFLARRTGR